jgi:IclR family pca regulon transcriptional regulator
MEEEATRSRYFVKVLERAFNVLAAFGATSPEMTLSAVATQTNLDRATARRILLSLVDMGYAEKEGKLFRLCPRVLRIGFSYLTSLGIAHRGQYVLETLTAEANKASSLSVLDGNEIVYVARSTVPGLASTATAIGARYPAHPTAMGRVLLASLPTYVLDNYFETAVLERITAKTVISVASLRRILKRVREQGYAYVAGELQASVAAIAVPVTKPGGRVIAAISLSTAGCSEQRVVREHLSMLRHAATLLSMG